MITQKIIAHKNNEVLETLEEHSEKTEKYVKKLIKADLLKNLPENSFQLIIEAIKNHDLGKINKNFQKKILLDKKEGYTDHALASIPYFVNFVSNNEKYNFIDEDLFAVLIYLISKHHGCLTQIKIGNIYTYKTSKFTRDLKLNDYTYLLKRAFDMLQEHKENFVYDQEKYYMDIQKFEKSYLKLEEKIDFLEIFEKSYYDFFLIKFIYSLLVSSDYYATYDFFQNQEVNNFGRIENMQDFLKNFNKEYIQMINDKEKVKLKINQIRTKLSFTALNNLKNFLKEDKYIFYLNAPTGAGKTLMSLNLLNAFKDVEKIFYVFPYNTIIDQTANEFSNFFKRGYDFEVINSISGIINEDDLSSDELLLKREMLHYPMILTSNVNFFNILFGNSKDINFNFWQLQNSVIIFDEVQSIPIELWEPFIKSIKILGKMFNIKFILMSATLPEKALNKFIDNQDLIGIVLDEKTLQIDEFKNRVEFKESLLLNKQYTDIDELFLNDIASIIEKEQKNKILIEFFSKKRAYQFSNLFSEFIKDSSLKDYKLLLITGDTNKIQRLRIIEDIKNSEKHEKIILVSTQVIEAGVDIDMDLGFKQTSIIESEEQFAGRINRSGKKEGSKVYLFDIITDNISKILKNDKIRTSSKFTLVSPSDDQLSLDRFYLKFDILKNKKFDVYYDLIGKKLIEKRFSIKNEYEEMFTLKGFMDFEKISQKMKIIKDDQISVYVPFKIKLNTKKYKYEKYLAEKFSFLIKNDILDGEKIFNYYMKILENKDIKFSEKTIKLKNLQEIFNLFVINVYYDFFEKKLSRYSVKNKKYNKIDIEYLNTIWDYQNKTFKEDLFL